MTDRVLEVQDAGKAYVQYSSEWKRVGSWLGLSPAPAATHWALRNVSFVVARGESVGLIGRNGAGKSTLLKLVAGTLRPSEGTVRSHGRVAAILELGMGFNPEFTGRQNATHAAGLMGYDEAAISGAMPSIEEFADIGEYFDRPTRILSSGMQMRVAFAVATAFSPDLLLVDEALSVGDLSFQAKCFARLASLREQGSAMVIVSHSVEEIVKHCPRALFVDGGTLKADAEARVVANAYLDHLWGRRPPTAAANPADDPSSFDGSASTERFAERPLYRKEEHRWGAGGARILDYTIDSQGRFFPALVESGDQMRVAMHVLFDRDVIAPVYGLLIKTHDGVFLYGTNSNVDASPGARPVRAGEHVYVEFNFAVGLNTGAFLLSLGVSSKEEGEEALVPLDRRYDSILFQVHGTKPIWGIVDLGARCRVLEAANHG